MTNQNVQTSTIWRSDEFSIIAAVTDNIIFCRRLSINYKWKKNYFMYYGPMEFVSNTLQGCFKDSQRKHFFLSLFRFYNENSNRINVLFSNCLLAGTIIGIAYYNFVHFMVMYNRWEIQCASLAEFLLIWIITIAYNINVLHIIISRIIARSNVILLILIKHLTESLKIIFTK